jgi:hypothetical protein
MATVVEQRLLKCSEQGKITVHHRNAERFNWVLHIVLSILTIGLWVLVIVFLLVANLFVHHDGWACSECGKSYP